MTVKYPNPRIVLTIGGYDIKDSPVFHSEEEVLAFIHANWNEYAVCGFRYL